MIIYTELVASTQVKYKMEYQVLYILSGFVPN